MIGGKALRKLKYFWFFLNLKVNPIKIEKIRKFMHEKDYLIAALGNYGFLELILNWVEGLKRLKIENYAVFTPDKRLYRELSKRRINTYFLKTNIKIPKKVVNYGTLGFNKIVSFKPFITYNLLKSGISVLLSDVDIAWLEDPMKYLRKGDYDIQVQCDHDEFFRIKDIENPYSRCNSGFYYAKSNKSTIRFFKRALQVSWIALDNGDQAHFNWAARFYRRFMKIRVLDPLKFPNGNIYFKKNKEFKKFKSKPVIIHVNWIVGNDKKINAMKKHNLWNL